MDMVGHDAPRQHAIPITITMQQGILHHHGKLWMGQSAASHASIQPTFDLFPAFGIEKVIRHVFQFPFQPGQGIL